MISATRNVLRLDGVLLFCALVALSGFSSGANEGAAASQAPEIKTPSEVSYPVGVRNTQKPEDTPLAPEEALRRISVPEGFHVTLFAGEPDVAQPISMSWDERGRLWVAECYSYEKSSGPWKSPVHDRILIFEDTNGDGRFNTRKVFWDQAKNLTSVLPGFGGVWACSTPELIFLPDRDRDDIPDGEPVVLLDGWNDGEVGHCVFNGLTWGPDGWLYGQQGIQGESFVGRPGAPKSERRRFNGGIWRFHPTRHVFEVVAEGTTNPWGFDFDDHGQAFFSNCVIGHLWHYIPGAHYKRMYGQDFTPNTYALMGECSDHKHYSGGSWQKSGDGSVEHMRLGGGHAHTGAMIYMGGNWPDTFRNTIFMHNIHGRRLNQDVLERRGSGYVARHGTDLMHSEDPWFRGVALNYGPDGAVYLSDWQDLGECHDNDGVHRTSGRLYRISYGQAKKPEDLDLAKLSDGALVEMQSHKNEWFVRQARRLLHERSAAGKDLSRAHEDLKAMLNSEGNVPRQLRALWALHVSGGIDGGGLERLLQHPNEHLRAWAVRLLVDAPPASASVIQQFESLARGDSSPLVRLFLASALQRIPQAERWGVAEGLCRHEDGQDANLPLMIWYGIEPVVASDRSRALQLAGSSKIPLIRQHIVRRLAASE
jgi:putative membrane-bound dehydrogenase-like protein